MIYKNYTIKEIKIVFGNLYNLDRAIGYLSWGQSCGEWDVIEKDNEIRVYYPGTSDWKLAVTGAKGIYK